MHTAWIVFFLFSFFPSCDLCETMGRLSEYFFLFQKLFSALSVLFLSMIQPVRTPSDTFFRQYVEIRHIEIGNEQIEES